MLRDFEPDIREPERERARAIPRPREFRFEPRELERRERDVYELRKREYRLNNAQAFLMREIGAFRTIEARDLERHVYRDREHDFEIDLKHLKQQNLLGVTTRDEQVGNRYVSLTRRGKELTASRLERNPEQGIYARTVKLRELEHDVRIYAMYRKEREAVEQEHGRISRVVLDYQLKRELQERLAAIQSRSEQEREEMRQQIAKELELKIVDGKIQIPDLRIEYEGRDGEMEIRDLEYCSRHYSRSQMSAKSRAGFKLYGGGSNGRKGRGRDIEWAAEIINL